MQVAQGRSQDGSVNAAPCTVRAVQAGELARAQDVPMNWSEHEQLAQIIGGAVVEGNEVWDERTLGLRAIEAIERAGYRLQRVVVGLPETGVVPVPNQPIVVGHDPKR